MHSGYHAVGTLVTLVTIQPGGEQGIVVKDIVQADLSWRRERVKHAARMIRLAKVLRNLEKILKRDLDVDMLSLTR